MTAEHVLAGGLVKYLRDNRASPPNWRGYLEAGAQVYRYDGHIPCNLFLTDESILIMNDRPEGSGEAIDINDETVRSGVNELFEKHRESAEPVEASFFL